MSNLESKISKATIVIRKNQVIKSDLINGFCENYFSRYAWIKHENDISTKTMEVEGIHYHIVGSLRERTRVGTLLNRLTAFIGFDNNFGIEIQSANCIEGCYQYLIHKNDKDKTPHDISEVITNIPQQEFITLMTTDYQDTTITQDRIEVIVNNAIRFDDKTIRVVVNYCEIARGIGATRCNCVSWALNNTIKQRVYELCYLHNIPIPDKY